MFITIVGSPSQQDGLLTYPLGTRTDSHTIHSGPFTRRLGCLGQELLRGPFCSCIPVDGEALLTLARVQEGTEGASDLARELHLDEEERDVKVSKVGKAGS